MTGGSWYKKGLVVGIIVLLIGASGVSGISVIESNDSEILIDSSKEIQIDSNKGVNTRHFYYFVNVDIDIYETIHFNYWSLDIQGKSYIPFFHIYRLSSSGGNRVVELTIRKYQGKTYDFTLTNVFSIFGIMLNDFNDDLPNMGYPNEGHIEGKVLFLTFNE